MTRDDKEAEPWRAEAADHALDREVKGGGEDRPPDKGAQHQHPENGRPAGAAGAQAEPEVAVPVAKVGWFRLGRW